MGDERSHTADLEAARAPLDPLDVHDLTSCEVEIPVGEGDTQTQYSNDLVYPPGMTEPEIFFPTDVSPATIFDELGYETVGLLGKGGMGLVQLVFTSLGYLATKSPDLASASGPEDIDDRVRHFYYERLLHSSLSHTSIPNSHGGDGPVFYMEPIGGVTLAHAADDLCRSRLSPDFGRVVAFALQTAHVLAYMGDKRVVHRDLKPANILLSDDGVVNLLDFGIARFFDQSGRFEPKGAPEGTPGYMAPESVLPDGFVTPLSDVYSLGVILYELATGKSLYSGDTRGIFRSTVRDSIEAPRSVNPDVPESLSSLIMEMLSKDHVMRPNARELVSGLETIYEELRAKGQNGHASDHSLFPLVTSPRDLAYQSALGNAARFSHEPAFDLQNHRSSMQLLAVCQKVDPTRYEAFLRAGQLSLRAAHLYSQQARSGDWRSRSRAHSQARFHYNVAIDQYKKGLSRNKTHVWILAGLHASYMGLAQLNALH